MVLWMMAKGVLSVSPFSHTVVSVPSSSLSPLLLHISRLKQSINEQAVVLYSLLLYALQTLIAIIRSIHMNKRMQMMLPVTNVSLQL